MVAKRRGRRRSRRTTSTGQGILIIVLLLVAGAVLAGRLGSDAEPAEAPPGNVPTPANASEAAVLLDTLPVEREASRTRRRGSSTSCRWQRRRTCRGHGCG